MVQIHSPRPFFSGSGPETWVTERTAHLATMRSSDCGEWLALSADFSLVRSRIRNDPTLSLRKRMGHAGPRFAPPSNRRAFLHGADRQWYHPMARNVRMPSVRKGRATLP